MRAPLLIVVFLFGAVAPALCCQCPPIELNAAALARYDIIFKGQVRQVTPCEGKPGIAVFDVEELFKGAIADSFPVLFDCHGECAKGFNVGEEWIIYTNYKQISNAKMDWCSRSRKYFRHEKEDYYQVNTGVDYYSELNFLRANLGLHRPLVIKQNAAENRNQRPGTRQSLIIVLCSVAAIVGFYALFRRFFR